MNLSTRVVEELLENKATRERGEYVAIPFLRFPKLMTVIPGIQKKRYSLISANAKVGKTQITDALFLQEPLYFLQTIKNSNLDIQILYFSLEVSAEDKFLTLISSHLFIKFNKILSTEDLRSYFEKYILEDEIAVYLKSAEFKEWSDFVLSKVTFVDNIRNPYGIYKYTRDLLMTQGNVYDKDNNKVDINQMYSYYKPNNPNLYTIVIVDHYSLFTSEKGGDLWQAIFDWSSNYALKLRDNFLCHIVGVQQQAADQEKQTFTFKGNVIINKLRPSPDGLADNKTTQRDVNYLFGLFSPSRYKIDNYEGFDISTLGDNYRELCLLLNRSGGGQINCDLYFDGRINFFKELPKVDSPELINWYSRIKANKTN